MGTVSYPAFLRLAGRLWFFRELRHYVPALTDDNLAWGPWGVRTQAVSREGELVDDFRMETVDRVFHVLNAPSPAATASLSTGEEIASRLIDLAEPA